jgi:hypothetical protein
LARHYLPLLEFIQLMFAQAGVSENVSRRG